LCVCFGDWVVAAGHPPSIDLLSSTGVSECAYLCVCVCVLVIGSSLQAIHPLWICCPAQVCLSVRICVRVCVCFGDSVVAAGHPPSMDLVSSTGVSECAYLCVCVLVIGSSLRPIHPLWIRCPAQVCLSVRICVCVCW